MRETGSRSRWWATRRRRQFEPSSLGTEPSRDPETSCVSEHKRSFRAYRLGDRSAGAGTEGTKPLVLCNTSKRSAVTARLVTVERDGSIAIVLLNRPQQLNALSDELMGQLVTALKELDRDEEIRCIVLGGSERAFAAGADIGELAQASAIELYYARRVERWDAIRALWTPLVAAVSGFCLGGGCA